MGFGMGMVMGALSGAGQGLAQVGASQTDYLNKSDLMKQQEELETQRAITINQAQLEAQRGGAVVVPADEIGALRSFYEIVRCHMMAEGGIPMSDALGLAMDTLDEIRDRAQQAKGE